MKRLFASILFLSVSLPAFVFAVPPLRTPWPCDTTYRITQGHNGGSHTGKGAWAWDIGIPVGGEVVAPADGVIRRVRMDSTTGGCSSAYGNDANYVIVDFGDGSEALFLHLQANSTNLKPGDRVVAGQPVGRIGLTGWVCGAHLHFQIQRNCDSWWCQSMPAQFETYGDPQSGSYESDNCGPPPECGAVASRADSVVIDEETIGCFYKYTSYWWSADGGHDNHHYYTFATDAPERETYGVWTFDVGEAGLYRVEAFIPDTEADSKSAMYEIFNGSETFVSGAIDQTGQKGWVDLGTYEFGVGEDFTVSLGDNTGEPADTRVKLAYDAIRLVPVEDQVTMPPGEEPTEQPGEEPTAGDPPVQPGDGGETTNPGLDGDGSSNVDEPMSVSTSSGCSAAGGATPGLLLLLAIFGLGWRRRRDLF